MTGNEEDEERREDGGENRKDGGGGRDGRWVKKRRKSERVGRQKKLRAAVTAHQDNNTVTATETFTVQQNSLQ